MKTITEGKDWNSISNKAKDLILHSDSDERLQDHRRIIKNNLSRSKKEGKYKTDEAVGLWGHHIDRAAISCCDKYGDGEKGWQGMFPGHVRKEASQYLEGLHKDSLHESINENEVMVEEFNPEKASFFLMLDDVLNKNLIGFKEKFNEALKDRLLIATENLKTNLTDHVFNDKLEEISAGLLGNYIKKAKNSMVNSRITARDATLAGAPKDDPVRSSAYNTFGNRSDGIDLASDKLVRSKAFKPAPNFNEEIYESNFSRLQSKLERKGLSAKEAGGIAYNEGRKKFGKKGMADKARRGREDD